MEKLDIIHEDEICLVLNKPAGLAVQGGKGIGVSLDSILSGLYSQRPLLVHRLDRDTSGIILVAKTKQAAAEFSVLFGGRIGIVKRYLAVCRGIPSQTEGIIKADIEIHGTVKKSETGFRQVQELSGGLYSMLELELGTGRMHQIRRHLSVMGNPILGDDKYGDFSLNRSLKKNMNLRHLLLHSSQLTIPKMPNGTNLNLTAKPPDYFLQFISA